MPNYQVVCTPNVTSLENLSTDKVDGNHAYRFIKIQSGLLSELKFSRIQKKGASCYFVSFLLNEEHEDYPSTLEHLASIKFPPSDELLNPPTLTISLDLCSPSEIHEVLQYLLKGASLPLIRINEIQSFIAERTKKNEQLDQLKLLVEHFSQEPVKDSASYLKEQDMMIHDLWIAASQEIERVKDYLQSPPILKKSIQYHYPIVSYVASCLEQKIQDPVHFEQFQKLLNQLMRQVESLSEETLTTLMEIKAHALLSMLTQACSPEIARLYRQEMLIALSYLQFSKKSDYKNSRFDLFKNTLSLLMEKEDYIENHAFFSNISPESTDNRALFAQYLIHITDKIHELNQTKPLYIETEKSIKKDSSLFFMQ